jgi:hypothetical protein
MNNIGLKLGENITVKKLSGPVSFYLLEPNNIYENIKLPYIILLGDEHENDEYRCTDINNIDNIESTTDFIKYINNIAEELNISFDLFMELGFFKKYNSVNK